MKKLVSVTLCLMLVLFSTLALAEDDRTLTMTGTATVTLAPDGAALTLGVSATAVTVGEAQAQGATAMQQLLDKLLALGVAREDVQTTDFSVSAQYDYSGDKPALAGYQVSNTFHVTIRDLTQVSTIIDGAMAAGANDIYGLAFTSTQQSAAYDQAMQQAAAEATRKAQLLATASGVELGAVQRVSEAGTAAAVPIFRALNAAKTDGAATPIEAGQLTVSCTVEIVYALK